MNKDDLLKMYAIEPNPAMRRAYEKSLRDLEGLGEKQDFACGRCAFTFSEYPEVVHAPWFRCPDCGFNRFVEVGPPIYGLPKL